MDKAHWSLRPEFNLVIIIIYLLVASLMFLLLDADPILLIAISTVFGLVLGVMQNKSIKEAEGKFHEARTAMAIRSCMKETVWGPRYLYSFWFFCAALIPLAIFLSYNPIFGWVLGYCVLGGARDLVTFSSTIRLSRLSAN